MSDIWDAFEKLAISQGLVTAAEKTETKKPSKRNSASEDTISLLYGVQPERIYEKEGEKDRKTIIEIAHPETAVVCPAYDAMNSVVENLHQRQDMMAYIALKMPSGHLTQRRYIAAKQELLNSLVRSAFTLDSKDETGLMSLADSCATRLDERGNQLIKAAVHPLLIGAVSVGAFALLAGAYYLTLGATTAQNVKINAQAVLDALKPLSDKPYASGIQTDVDNLMNMADELYELTSTLSNVKSVDEAVSTAQVAVQNQTLNVVRTRINNYIKQLKKIRGAIPGWVQAIKFEHQKENEGQSDWWAKLTGLADELYMNKWETLVDRLAGQENWVSSGQTGGLLGAIDKDIETMVQARSMAKAKAPEIKQALTPEEPAQEIPLAASRGPEWTKSAKI